MKMPSRRSGSSGSKRRLPMGLLALALLFAPWLAQAQNQAPPPAQGPEAPQLPAADQQAILHYNLNEDVFNRLLAVTKEARADGIRAQPPGDPSSIHSLDDLAAQSIAGDSRIAPLIKKHGFTPREFLLANLALMNAAVVEQAKNDPELASQIDQSKVNQTNVAFLEAHQAQLSTLMQPGGNPQQ